MNLISSHFLIFFRNFQSDEIYTESNTFVITEKNSKSDDKNNKESESSSSQGRNLDPRSLFNEAGNKFFIFF